MNSVRPLRVFRSKIWAESMRHRFAMVLRGLAVGVCLWLIAAPALAALGKNEIRELEGLLADLGFDPGPVDGVLDEETRTAIKGYQDFAALPITGGASWGLFNELRDVTEILGDVRIPQAKSWSVSSPPTTQKIEIAPAELPEGDHESFAMHLASLRTKEVIEGEWKKLQSQFPKLLGQRELIIRSVEIEALGTFFRIMTGPFEARSRAQELCDKFKAREQYCMVLRLTEAR